MMKLYINDNNITICIVTKHIFLYRLQDICNSQVYFGAFCFSFYTIFYLFYIKKLKRNIFKL